MDATSTKQRSISVGIIGMGDMGKMYCRVMGDAGWRYISISVLFRIDTTFHGMFGASILPVLFAVYDDLSAFGSSTVFVGATAFLVVALTTGRR